MVTIYDREFKVTHEAQLLSNGIDFLLDVMIGCGIEPSSDFDICNDFELNHEETTWWLRWAEREQRILDYVEENGEEAEDIVCKLAMDYGYDLEVLQDKTEEVFGLSA